MSAGVSSLGLFEIASESGQRGEIVDPSVTVLTEVNIIKYVLSSPRMMSLKRFSSLASYARQIFFLVLFLLRSILFLPFFLFG